LFPKPANYIIAVIAVIFFLFISLISFVFSKLTGVVVTVEGNLVKIYNPGSSLLNPKKNELIYQWGGKNLNAIALFTKDNIVSARKITSSEEINRIKNMTSLGKSIKVKPVNILLNESSLKDLAFVSDYSNLVEIKLKNLIISQFPEHSNVKNFKMLVSVKTPEEFLKAIK